MSENRFDIETFMHEIRKKLDKLIKSRGVKRTNNTQNLYNHIRSNLNTNDIHTTHENNKLQNEIYRLESELNQFKRNYKCCTTSDTNCHMTSK